MASKRVLIPLFLLCGLAIPVLLAQNAATTTTTVTLSGVHICCNTCVTGVRTATTPVTGLTAVASQSGSTIALTAASKETIQKGVDALTAAGYFGKSSDAAIKVNAETNAKDGKVKTLDVEGVHLCCNSCVTAVKALLTKVDGIKGDNVTSKATSITLTGDFEPKAFFTELQKAGLTGKVAAPKP